MKSKNPARNERENCPKAELQTPGSEFGLERPLVETIKKFVVQLWFRFFGHAEFVPQFFFLEFSY